MAEASLHGEPAPVYGCVCAACSEKLYSVWRRSSSQRQHYSGRLLL